MKIEFETKEDFLLDMLEYYSEDPEGRRCANVQMTCSYSPKSIGKEDTSEGCAIGRVLEPGVAQYLDNEMSGCGVEDAEEHLPEWMISLGVSFLQDVQVLHDSSHCWESDGLTGDGMSMLDNVIKVNKLDRELFLNYF